MTPGTLLVLVLLAAFALAGLALAALLALAWHLGLRRAALTSLDLVGLRLLPAAGALLVMLAVVLPAFLSFEPEQEQETAGPWLILLAVIGAACLVAGMWRAWRAVRAARALLSQYRLDPRGAGQGTPVHIVEATEPLVAVVGAWRPCVVATGSVRAACDGEEFHAVLAHEAAHVAARDNLKLLLLIAAPDALSLTSLAASLTERWRAAAESEADARATGSDSGRRLALASALIKLARLVSRREVPRPLLGMSVAGDDVPARVRALLEPPARPMPPRLLAALSISVLLIPLLALPRYALLHELIERLVGLGR
jgi:beta-lactamase regulating signal transducer with metallopeptidase domain